jgi:hypothetical protein
MERDVVDHGPPTVPRGKIRAETGDIEDDQRRVPFARGAILSASTFQVYTGRARGRDGT